MTYEEISKHHRAKPFVPFNVHLTDGRVVTIDHPRYAGWNYSRTVFIFSDVGYHYMQMPLGSISHLDVQRVPEPA